jgi:hypothetical protein
MKVIGELDRKAVAAKEKCDVAAEKYRETGDMEDLWKVVGAQCEMLRANGEWMAAVVAALPWPPEDEDDEREEDGDAEGSVVRDEESEYEEAERAFAQALDESDEAEERWREARAALRVAEVAERRAVYYRSADVYDVRRTLRQALVAEVQADLAFKKANARAGEANDLARLACS